MGEPLDVHLLSGRHFHPEPYFLYGDLTTLTPARSQAQKERVKALVSAFNALPPENRFAITLWGLRDPESWLIDFWDRPDWPLLFDALYRLKPAYDGFLEALEEAF